MKNGDVDEKKLGSGEYCRSKAPGCFCKVGWPYERQCRYCRDLTSAGADSYCVCPPKDVLGAKAYDREVARVRVPALPPDIGASTSTPNKDPPSDQESQEAEPDQLEEERAELAETSS